MKIITAIGVCALVSSAVTFAGETGNHFPSVESNDLASALCNLHNYNAKLAAITRKAELSALDMVKVHELTYTLENAIGQLQQDLIVIAEDLEKVHKASESLTPDVIKTQGKTYLTQTGLITGATECSAK